MEFNLPIIISIISIVFCIATFVVNRIDKAKKDTKDDAKEDTTEKTNLALINYRLDELDKNVQKILAKLDISRAETKKLIDEEMEKHIAIYHK